MLRRHCRRSVQGVRPLVLAVHMVAAGAVLAAPVWVPEAQAQTPDEQARRYAIPAGPLTATLNRFAEEAGVLLSALGELTQGKTSPGLSGEFTVARGFAQLLAGTTPSAVTEGTGSFTTKAMSSATHLPLTMRETPQSVTVLTSARIAADNIVDLVDIAKAAPGLSLAPGDVRPELYSRGYQVESVTQDGIASLYDAYAGGSLGNLAMQDRVEVVRGATGLMQGAGNPSAAINMIRKRPTRTWQVKGSASAGSWDDYRTMADVSGPLTEDGRVRGRVVGSIQDAGDFYDLAFNNKRLGYATVDVDLTESPGTRSAS